MDSPRWSLNSKTLVSFTAPIDLARVMYEMVRRYGRYVRPALGIYVVALNKALKTLYRLPTDRGLLVVDVVPGSPAEEMELASDDVVTRVNGREVTPWAPAITAEQTPTAAPDISTRGPPSCLG